MFSTGDPAEISLLLSLANVGLQWRDLTDQHVSDASYRRAMEILICAGLVDAKVELVVQMEDRLGSIRAVYQCHGPCYDLLDGEADRHTKQNRDWADDDGNIIGEMLVTKRPLAVRWSVTSINELKLDRPAEKMKVLPELVRRLARETANDRWLDVVPEIVLLEINATGRSGPDPSREGVLYWHGEAYNLDKKNWQLLRAVWGGAADVWAVCQDVWGTDEMPVSTAKAQLHRLNKQLGDLNLPLAWRIEAGKFIRE